MPVRPLFSASALLALAATIVGAPVTMAGGSSIRMFDSDGDARPGDCDASGPADDSIQEAVDAAGPGDTILVWRPSWRSPRVLRRRA